MMTETNLSEALYGIFVEADVINETKNSLIRKYKRHKLEKHIESFIESYDTGFLFRFIVIYSNIIESKGISDYTPNKENLSILSPNTILFTVYDTTVKEQVSIYYNLDKNSFHIDYPNFSFDIVEKDNTSGILYKKWYNLRIYIREFIKETILDMCKLADVVVSEAADID
jgi:hypothetical protein